MRKIIDIVAIFEAANSIKEKIEVLKNLQTTLLADIAQISTIYTGNDSSIIVSKYKERANGLTSIINHYENLYIYMAKIAGAYQDNNDETMKKFKYEEMNDGMKDGELYV